ncbi:MAG TPA: phage tail sheath C-terminal domain-containing protein [Candidatus Dormibacteraeota bacterium]|nr:phage tail sheath C-terminal domain-containing protein [Candidatus Dormibacteraeota bacterium]
MATTYLTPGVYVEEIAGGPRPITPVGTSTAAFVGEAPKADAHVNEAVAINNISQFMREFVPADGAQSTPLSHAVYGFFYNGGSRCYVVNPGKGKAVTGGGRGRQGLQVLEQVDEVNIVAAPGYTDAASYDAVLSHCESLKSRVAILDPPADVTNIDLLTKVMTSKKTGGAGGDRPDDGGGGNGLRPRNSAGGFGTMYFPQITVRDPLAPDKQVNISPAGHMAGIWARSDTVRGVHKAPANEVVRGALDVTYRVTQAEQGELNPAGINVIRYFEREGILSWGARTLDVDSSEWRYLNVRRLFIMIEQSIARSTRWIVFEPNDRTLWKSIKRDINAFLTQLWRGGALMGATPGEAFFCQCDEETNPPESIDLGIVVTVIGIAPVKPAEFIVFRLHQWEGGSAITAVG